MTPSLDAARWLTRIEAAGRAPSPHNIQPARWRWLPEGRVELHEATASWLSAGDPTGRDNAMALGAAWEGLSLALSEDGLTLQTPTLEAMAWPAPAAPTRRVAHAGVEAGGPPDELAAWVMRRASYRGRFTPAPPAARDALAQLAATHGAVLIDGVDARDAVARDYDIAAAEGLLQPGFAEELYAWMRFDPADARWSRDGLSTDCLALSPLECTLAAWALRPAFVRLLGRAGLHRLLVSEADKVRSALAVVLLHAPADEPWFDAGRRLYRFWLDLARHSLCGVPMSALMDAPAQAAALLKAHPLPAGRRLIAVLRVGPEPAVPPARSARLPATELLLPA